MADILSPLDAYSNVEVNLPLTETQAGYATVLYESDAGDQLSGARSLIAPECSSDYRTRAGLDAVLMSEFFPGSAVNSTVWNQTLTTMTCTQASGFMSLNAGASVASGAIARVQSYQFFPVYGAVTTYAEGIIQFTQAPQTSNLCEWGLGLATGTTAPTDGVFMRLNASGEFRCIVSYGGSEATSGVLSNSLLGTNTIRRFTIEIGMKACNFWIDNVLIATVAVPAAAASAIASGTLPWLFRNYNSGVTGAAQIMKISNCTVSVGDIGAGRDWQTMIGGQGGNASQGPTGGTIGSTCQWANTTTPSAAAATNTTAALGTGIGGLFLMNAAATSTTDVIVSSYLNPAGTNAIPGRKLLVYGCWLDAVNTGAAVAGTPTTHAYAVAYGHNALTLVTAEGIAAKAPRRQPLGMCSWIVAAAVGAPANRIYAEFPVPLVVNPSEYLAVVCKVLVGTATASQVIMHTIGFNAAWE